MTIYNIMCEIKTPDWFIAHRIEDAGDGVFIVFTEPVAQEAEKYYVDWARARYEDVQWCPDPDSHGDDAFAVLNCFYKK